MDALGKVILVCGPTATGKTALALHLARCLGGEVLGADSMQIYKGLGIGTATPTAKQLGNTAYHLVNFLSPTVAYSVAGWLQAARCKADEIIQNGHLPVVCGGTGLYISSFVSGTAFAPQQVDEKLMESLKSQWEENAGESLMAKLLELDPARAQQLHKNDKKRVLRAMYLVLSTGETAQTRQKTACNGNKPYSTLCLGLKYKNRAAMYHAINNRVDEMIASGLLQEAAFVWQNKACYKTAAQAIGYKELFPYFNNTQSLDECVENLKQASRNYAKRQLTWFNNKQYVQWLYVDAEDIYEKALKMAENFCKNI